MSFGLGHGRSIDPAPGAVLVTSDELGPLPDSIIDDPTSAWQDLCRWFPEPHRPLHLEIGCGKGAFLVEQAGLTPEVNYLGVEWAREFAEYAADRIRRRRDAGTHHNIRLLCTDATELLRWRTPTESLEVIHLYFSDPWPKAKHHKKRVIQDRFLADAWRTLQPGGELRIVTDHDDLWAWCETFIERWTDATKAPSANTVFERKAYIPPPTARPGELVGTNYERKFRPIKEAQGGVFHSATLVKPALVADS